MRKTKTDKWVRIRKDQAKKRYDFGLDVYILPCNMNPENIWQKPINMYCRDRNFNQVVHEYTYYNCNTKELGYYPAFYITRKEYEERIKFI